MQYNEGVLWANKGEVKYIQFYNIKKHEDFVTHGFTTRIGGVSRGECESLNLGFNRNDPKENVEENYRRIADALGIECENMVLSRQVHDNKIREVTTEDRGKGIFLENDLAGFDALMTDVPEVALVTFYADCVPVFFLDPVKKVIALAHSGWRGTVKEIGAETVRRMEERYGSRPEELEVAIGPSIGSCCFEVGEEVYDEFIKNLEWSEKYCKKTKENKWHIHLQDIIKQSLLHAGVGREKIVSSGICTKCNKAVFFSHRGDQGKTGSLAAIMQLRR